MQISLFRITWCFLLLREIIAAELTEDLDPDLQSDDDTSVRIIEGVNVHLELFDFLVSLIHKQKHVCGGSIISHFFVLTAAHCCFSRGKERQAKNMIASVGNKYYQDGIRYQVEKKYIHPDYHRETNVNDLSLMRLRDRLVFGAGVGWVKLHPLQIMDNEMNITATVIGWGYTNDEERLVATASFVLESVQIYSVPLEECKKHYKNVRSTNICMTGQNMKGSCTGDSGGPLVSTENRIVMQIGLVSYGSSCNNTVPEVYTRVSSFYGWIMDTMKESKIKFAKKELANKRTKNV